MPANYARFLIGRHRSLAANRGDFQVRDLAQLTSEDREILAYLAFPKGSTALLREDGAVESWPPENAEPQRSSA